MKNTVAIPTVDSRSQLDSCYKSSPGGKVFKVIIQVLHWIRIESWHFARNLNTRGRSMSLFLFYIGRCHLHSYECVQCIDDK